MSARDRPSRPPSVAYRNTDGLTPDPRNARTDPDTQIAQPTSATAPFGFTNPVQLNEGGVLIAEHGRLRTTKKPDRLVGPTRVGGLRKGD